MKETLLRAGGLIAVVIGVGALLIAGIFFLSAIAFEGRWAPGIYVAVFGIALVVIGAVCYRLPGPEETSSQAGMPTGNQDRSTWNDPLEYANALVALVGQPVPGQTTGLETNQEQVRMLGDEINAKFGFQGMQTVWEEVRLRKGPQATSDLNRIWNGIGQWRK